MEVGEAVLALHLIDTQLNLAESVVLVLLEIGEGDLEDPALQRVVGVLETGRPVDEGLADTERQSMLESLAPLPFVVASDPFEELTL